MPSCFSARAARGRALSAITLPLTGCSSCHVHGVESHPLGLISDIDWQAVKEPFTRRVLEFLEDVDVPEHTHGDQWEFAVAGRVELHREGETELIEAGGMLESVTYLGGDDLDYGRARVNCTAPAAEGGRFHWFCHPWIVRSREGP